MRIKAIFSALAILTMAASATACATTSNDGEPRAERSSNDQPVRGGYY
jgi:hypothetical protein